MNALSWIAVFIGGGLGSLLRFGMSHMFRNLDVSTTVWATFSSNLIATGILGWVVFKLTTDSYSPTYFFLAVGLCGGFSTFSTFSMETVQMIRDGQIGLATFNVIGSVLACIFLLLILSKIWK